MKKSKLTEERMARILHGFDEHGAAEAATLHGKTPAHFLGQRCTTRTTGGCGTPGASIIHRDSSRFLEWAAASLLARETNLEALLTVAFSSSSRSCHGDL